MEVGNKFSLMGVFGSDIAFPIPPQPVTLPKFGIVTWLLFDIDDAPKAITLRVLGPPNRTEIVKLEAQGEPEFPYPPDELSQKGSLRFMIPIFGLQLSEEGFIEVMIESDTEPFRAGRLRVRFNAKPEEVGLPPTPSS
jgi:hypothetical protein